MNTIIFLLANACQIYLICDIVRIFYENTQQHRIKKWIVGIIFYVFNSCIYLMFHTAWLNLFSNLAGIYIYNCLFTKSIKKKLFVTGVLYVMGMGCDIISVLLLSGYRDGKAVAVISHVLTALLLLICKYITEKIVRCGKNQNGISNMGLVIVPVCSIVIIPFLMYGNNSLQFNVLIVGAGLLVINFVVLCLYQNLASSMQEKFENEILEQQLEVYRNQLKVIQQSQEQVQQLRHDMKHHIGELRFLAEQNDVSAFKKYCTQMEESVCNSDEKVYSGNMKIDSILNYMLGKAEKELKEVQSTVQIPREIEHTFDISTVLGNLLDNAIEAAKKSKEQFLSINIRFDKGVLHIIVKNSFSGELQRKENKFLTTKAKKDGHGIGLESVQRIVEKNHGEFEIQTGKLFCVNIAMYIPDSDKISDFDNQTG